MNTRDRINDNAQKGGVFMKRILSVILVLSILMIPVTAFADVTTVDRVDKEYTNPIADKLWRNLQLWTHQCLRVLPAT